MNPLHLDRIAVGSRDYEDNVARGLNCTVMVELNQMEIEADYLDSEGDTGRPRRTTPSYWLNTPAIAVHPGSGRGIRGDNASVVFG